MISIDAMEFTFRQAARRACATVVYDELGLVTTAGVARIALFGMLSSRVCTVTYCALILLIFPLTFSSFCFGRLEHLASYCSSVLT